MKSQLMIPGKIKVGFNLRSDTYTGKLGYVIYHDGKTWRKETSWEGWRQKEGQKINHRVQSENGQWDWKEIVIGKEINPLEFENVPTEGFVLNKKAGGYSSGWNHRQTYCRVYDPRGFEFEITVPNLLFILQESSSFKGKGLEGEFVYSWEGKDLVLLPVSCEDYKKSTNFTQLQSKKIGAKDLVAGCSYQTKRQQNLIYLGKFNWYSLDYTKDYSAKQTKMDKYYIFVNKDNKYEILSGLSTLALKISDVPVPNYAELMDEFSKSKYASKPISLEEKSIAVNFEQESDYHNSTLKGRYILKENDEVYGRYYITPDYKFVNHSDHTRTKEFQGYILTKADNISINKEGLKIITVNNGYNNYHYNDTRKRYTKEQIEAFGFMELFVNLENNSKVELSTY